MKKILLQIIVLLLLLSLCACKNDNDKKYKVSEEQWNELSKEYNYTLQQIENGTLVFTQKYTKDVLEIDGKIMLLIDNKQYTLNLIDDVWVAYDTTYLDMWHGQLLESFDYNDFKFDEESKMYICEKYKDQGVIYEFKFENGYPTHQLVTYTSKNYIYEIRYSNIGTTVIEVPEYIFYEEYESQLVKTVTEEQCNINANEMNFTLKYFISNETFKIHTQKSTSDGYQIDDQIIIIEDGIKYVLEQENDAWVATKAENINIFEGPLLKNLNYNDFEYDIEEKMYVQKNTEGQNFKYSISFTDGIVALIIVEELSNSENPATICYSVSDIGTTIIEVPNYTIK